MWLRAAQHNQRKPDQSDLSDPTTKEHSTGQQYPLEIHACSLPTRYEEKGDDTKYSKEES